MTGKLSLKSAIIPLTKVMKRTQTAPAGKAPGYGYCNCNCQCGGCNR